MSIAQDEKARPSDRLKAAELLGKVNGVRLFESNDDAPMITRINSAIDLEAKLKQLATLHQPQHHQQLTIQTIDIVEEDIDQSAI